MTEAIATPCIKVCIVDGRADICLGCGRTTAEIAAWGAMSEAERAALLPSLPRRLTALGTRQGRRAALAGRARAAI